MKRLIVAILLFCALAYAQSDVLVLGAGRGSTGPVYSPIALGVHCAHDNATASSTTVACGTITPSAGSLIACSVKVSTTLTGGTMASLSDAQGKYQYSAGPLRDPNHDYILFSFYRENASASSINPTATTANALTHSQIECREYKNVRTTHAYDSNFVASQAAQNTSGSSGSSLTPTNANEVIDAGIYLNATSTATAGTNFTQLDGAAGLWPQYWIQTTATATNAPFTSNTLNYYADSMAAFSPTSLAGTCDSTSIYDWAGGTDGGTPTTTTLASSVHGNLLQGNVDWAYNSGSGFQPGQWVIGNTATGITYAAAAAQSFATSEVCPIYSGTANSGLGLKRATGNPTSNVKNNFITTSSNVSFAACIWTDTPVSHAGTVDVVNMSGGDVEPNADYVNLQMNSNGSTATFALEAPTRTTQTSTTHWTQNGKFWIVITYKRAGQHTIAIYSGCGASPTLLETLTTPSGLAGGGPADRISFFGGNSDSYAAGTNFYIGSAKLDRMFGATLLP